MGWGGGFFESEGGFGMGWGFGVWDLGMREGGMRGDEGGGGLLVGFAGGFGGGFGGGGLGGGVDVLGDILVGAFAGIWECGWLGVERGFRVLWRE